MTTTGYLIISIGIIVFFVILFFVTFVINRRTPVPKGCEHLKISEENCGACTNTECSIRKKFDIDLVKEEIEQEKEEEE